MGGQLIVTEDDLICTDIRNTVADYVCDLLGVVGLGIFILTWIVILS